jgi:hypothetical protein
MINFFAFRALGSRSFPFERNTNYSQIQADLFHGL